MSLLLSLYMAYKNKEDQAKFAKTHYENNKDKCKKRALDHNRETRVRNRLYIKNYLSNHPCIDCGETDVIVLEFDHVRGIKSGNLGDALSRCWSINKIQEEIDKCEVRCANCHRRVTHQRRNYCGIVQG